MPLTAGHRLGAYEVIALLGKGGMGEVYRAVERHPDALLIVRVYHQPRRPITRQAIERPC